MNEFPCANGRVRLIDQWWIPLWLAAALFAIFQTGPMPLYSTRTLGVAWEMWNSGQFLVPYANGEPYSHKVPLLFWLIHLGWAIGGVNDLWPRVLEVLIGLGVLLAAQRLARVLFREQHLVAMLTPWILAAFSYAFLFNLQIMYEPLLCLCVMLALNALVGRDPWRAPWFGWFALAVAGGLMAKGPVMLLHIAFPFLLGPLWHPWAARQRGAWYLRGGLALLTGCAVLLGWALWAAAVGGETYRNELFFMQTTGRMVDSFDHAHPWWWYLSKLPLLALPWILWPRLWQGALRATANERGPGPRFLVCWLLPTLIAFSLVSGKQPYYLLPEAAGGAILLALGIAHLARRARPAHRLSGPWAMGALFLAGAAALYALPESVAAGQTDSIWYVDLSSANRAFVWLAAALGVAMLIAPRKDVAATKYIASLSIVAVAAIYTLFSQTLWPRFDLAPIAQRVAHLQAAGTSVVHFGLYQNQFQFLGRLQRALPALDPQPAEEWALANPQGRIVHQVRNLTLADLRSAEFVQPFRSDWLLIERADLWLSRRSGSMTEPSQALAEMIPSGYWPYRRLLNGLNAIEVKAEPSPMSIVPN